MKIEEALTKVVGVREVISLMTLLFGEEIPFIQEARRRLRTIGNTMREELGLASEARILSIAESADVGPKTEAACVDLERWLEAETEGRLDGFKLN